MVNRVTYCVDIREVYISSREIEAKPGTSEYDIIKLALASDNEIEFGYSHTLGSENHTVRGQS